MAIHSFSNMDLSIGFTHSLVINNPSLLQTQMQSIPQRRRFSWLPISLFLYTAATKEKVAMSSSWGFKIFTCLALALVLCVQTVLGGITCENLNKDSCAFAVSSTSTRCVLEKRVRRGGMEEYTCRSSEIEAEKLKDWIETDQCIESCGLDRNTLGISTDSLLDSQFVKKLCSTQCYQGCPNIVDLFFNLAAGEGVFLPKLCEAQGGDARREMAEIKSSGIVAPAPGFAAPLSQLDFAPAMAPF